MHAKRWEVALRAPQSQFDRFPELPPLVVQILFNRGITTPVEVKTFLNHQWDTDDPFALQGMGEAVERLSWAIHRQEKIAIYGDYDADGVTASALMMQFLQALGANPQVYIPNRFEEGYGLNNEALAELAGQGVKLVLTVDCGIRSVKEVAYANSLGLDMIITDHHHVGEEIPPAVAAINPKRKDCAYPFKELAGVGLAYKLAQALLRTPALRSQRQRKINPDYYFDLVALGTVADLAPLHGENRKLVEKGLQAINRAMRPGLAALMSRAGFKPGNPITAGTIGFTIGPRLNAAGRLDSALAAYHLLMSRREAEAAPLATALDQQNRARQQLTEDTVKAARQIIEERGAQSLYFISHPAFNPGIVGLAASRLSEELYRPTLVAEQGPETTKGSARSIPEFHITEALDQCADLLVRYGGHAAAAGFTVENRHLPALEKRLQDIAAQKLNEAELRPSIFIDGELNLRGVDIALVEAVTSLQPFGYGNPTPRFLTRNLQLKYKSLVGRDHLKLVLHDGRQTWSAIAFRQGHWFDRLTPNQNVDVVYNLEFNEWNGNKSIQLNIKDLRPGEE